MVPRSARNYHNMISAIKAVVSGQMTCNQAANVFEVARNLPEFLTTYRGTRLLKLRGYTFSRQCESGFKTRWFCSSHHSKGCKAFIYTSAVFARTARGAMSILIDGYKFIRHRQSASKTRWFCGTHHHKGCRAVVYTTFDNDVIRVLNQHNHLRTHTVDQ
ncbi:unnamed protein product, partial [Iphiclides podalirius]